MLLKRLKNLDAKLREKFGVFESRAYVDTGPVVERALATAAGLGWTGKNTCLIHPKLGSFGFLAVLLTSLDVSPEEKTAELLVKDHCGTCTRCLDACPTGALIAPYQMDATKCISYLTIEHRGTIAPELMAGMGRQVFGCDICQDVCPWNRKAPIAADAELEPRDELVNPALEWLASLDEKDFERVFNGSPVRRAGFAGIAAEYRHRYGQQRKPRLRIAFERVGRVGRRKYSRRCTMGDREVDSLSPGRLSVVDGPSETQHVTVVVFDLEGSQSVTRVRQFAVDWNVFRCELRVKGVGIVGVDVDVPSRPLVARMSSAADARQRAMALEHQHDLVAPDEGPVVIDVSLAAAFIGHVEAELRLVEVERSRQIVDNEKWSGADQHGSSAHRIAYDIRKRQRESQAHNFAPPHEGRFAR